MAERKTEKEIALDLADFLSTKGYGGYGRAEVSPLTEAIQRRIAAMTNDIAREVVEATPQLREVIHAKVTAAVSAALLNDAALSAEVIKAVAQRISDVTLVRRGEELED